MTLLSKAQILQATDLPTEDVEVPEWGGTVRVRAFSGAARDAFEQAMLKTDAAGKRSTDFSNMRARLVAMCLIDVETGERMFEDHEVALLGAKSAAALERVFSACQRLNGMSADAVEGAAKNSDAAPSGASTSA